MRKFGLVLWRFIVPADETNPLLPILGWVIMLAFIAFVIWGIFNVASSGCGYEATGWECYGEP